MGKADGERMDETYLTIGEFGRLARLSGKALRLYDSLGLLTPVSVDPRTGYRRYTAGQLTRARRIVLLRGVGMPLARIGEVLQLDDYAIAHAVQGWWRQVESQHESRRSLVRYLHMLLTEGTTTMYEIQTRDVPDQKVLTIQRRVLVDDLQDFWAEAPLTLSKHLQAAGAEPAGHMFGIYHGPVNEDADGPVEICLPFTGTVEPTGEMTVRIERAHREAYTRITKGQVVYPKIIEAYDAVQQWLSEHGGRMTASPREVYFADWSVVGDADPACDIAYPCDYPADDSSASTATATNSSVR